MVLTILPNLYHVPRLYPGTWVIVWDIRLPYALMAVVVGLGLAGAEMQTILNNPLASQFTLGVSSAAAFGAALAIVLGIGIPGIPDQWFISANAFVFALFAALMLDAVIRWTQVATSGVVLFGIALVLMMQFIANEDTLQGLVFWTMGSLARASLDKLGVLCITLLVPFSLLSSWKLTALLLGEDRAVSFSILASTCAACASLPCCASVLSPRWQWCSSGPLSLLVWWHRISPVCCLAKITASICLPVR